MGELHEILSLLLAVLNEEPGLVALGAMVAGLVWRVGRRLRIDSRFVLPFTKGLNQQGGWAATTLGLPVLVLDLLYSVLVVPFGVRIRPREPKAKDIARALDVLREHELRYLRRELSKMKQRVGEAEDTIELLVLEEDEKVDLSHGPDDTQKLVIPRGSSYSLRVSD